MSEDLDDDEAARLPFLAHAHSHVVLDASAEARVAHAEEHPAEFWSVTYRCSHHHSRQHSHLTGEASEDDPAGISTSLAWQYEELWTRGAEVMRRQHAVGYPNRLSDGIGALRDLNEAPASRSGTSLGDFESFARSSRALLRAVALAELPASGPDGADDLAQATLVAVWNRWRRHGPPEHPVGYAVTVARRLARAYRHAEARLRTVPIDQDGAEPRAHDEVGASPLRLDLERAISRLPDRQRAVVRLSLRGLTAVEIGDRLHLDAGTVRYHLCRARERLRALLDESEG